MQYIFTARPMGVYLHRVDLDVVNVFGAGVCVAWHPKGEEATLECAVAWLERQTDRLLDVN